MPELEIGGKELSEARLDLLDDNAELAVIKRMSHYPRIVKSSAHAHEPHRIAFTSTSLRASFTDLWSRGKELPHLRFIIDGDPELTGRAFGFLRRRTNHTVGPWHFGRSTNF